MEAWQEKRNVAESVTYAFEKSLWTDVELNCTTENGETQHIKAHKMILASRSPVFEAMLFGPAADKGNIIQITTFSFEQMDLLLRFLYSEVIELSDDIAVDVLKTAHFFQVPSLVDECCQLLQSGITIENVYERLELAFRYDNERLRNATCEYIDENASKVIQTDGFLKMSQNCLKYVLKGDTFHVDEKTILRRAIEWVRLKEQCKRFPEEPCKSAKDEAKFDVTLKQFRKTLGGAFKYIRLGILSFPEFSECAENTFRSKEIMSIIHYTNICTNEKFKEMRVPKNETIAIYTGYAEKTKVNKHVSLCYDIKVSKTMYCEGIRLSDLRICYDQQLNNFERAVDLYSSFSTKIKVYIYKLGFSYDTTLNSLAPIIIKFETPLLLQKSPYPYQIQVTAKAELAALTLTIETSEIVKGSIGMRNGEVKWSSQPSLVRLIMFTNLSNRDLTENCDDDEDDDYDDNEKEDDDED